MSVPDKRRWFQKKRYIIPGLAALGLAAAVAFGGSTPANIAPAPIPAPAVHTYVAPVAKPVVAPVKPAPYQAPSPLSNDNYYTNVNGNRVHSPAYSNSVPAGASARCGDGTYSFSQNRRGTCSHHGGVAEWL